MVYATDTAQMGPNLAWWGAIGLSFAGMLEAAVKLYVMNDTSGEAHAGCKAVMRSIYGQLAQIAGVEIVARHAVGSFELDAQAFEAADAILINGEGTIHHSTRRAQHLMAVILEAKAMGKRVLLVNALFQQYQGAPDLLADLSLLTVREPRSAAFARVYGGQPTTLLDSAADTSFMGPGRATPLTSGLVIGYAKKVERFPVAFAALQGHKLSMFHGGFDDIVATLRQAKVYITGQHHGVYAAALAGCPFVTVRSTSHKIESFIDWTGLPIPVCQTPGEIEPALEFAMANPSIYKDLQQFMAEQSILTAPMIAGALGL